MNDWILFGLAKPNASLYTPRPDEKEKVIKRETPREENLAGFRWLNFFHIFPIISWIWCLSTQLFLRCIYFWCNFASYLPSLGKKKRCLKLQLKFLSNCGFCFVTTRDFYNFLLFSYLGLLDIAVDSSWIVYCWSFYFLGRINWVSRLRYFLGIFS